MFFVILFSGKWYYVWYYVLFGFFWVFVDYDLEVKIDILQFEYL